MIAPPALLEVRELSLRFGGLTAVDRVSFSVRAGEIVSVIGPNGAGKTSLFNAITGVHPPTSGSILLNGRPLARQLNGPSIARWLAVALLSAVLLGLSCDIVGLWVASGVIDYAPPLPFNWHAAVVKTISRLGATGWPLGGAVNGFVLGFAGAAAVWRRSRQEPEQAVRSGLARTFQNIRLFKELSVLDNVLVGMDSQLHHGSLSAVLRTPGERRETRAAHARAVELLSFVGLSPMADSAAGSLAYGHQRRLEIARALAAEPRLVLLDEPAAGMNPREADDLIQLIKSIRDRGVTVLLIEHHMRVVMGISDRIIVLHFGHPLASGTPAEVRADPRVIDAYLGTEPRLGSRISAMTGTAVKEVVLELSGVHAGYGGIQALRGVSLRVHHGEIVALIGANGAGKTTTLMCISGIVPTTQGTISFQGRSLTQMAAHRIVACGLSHVPEGRKIFAQLTVQENLLLGAYTRRDQHALPESFARVFSLFPLLKERRHQRGGTLSGGEQQMLAIARALMAKPQLLLMDEPSMGVAPLLVARIFAAVRELNHEGLSILLVEQNAQLALQTACRAYVLETGCVVLDGDSAQLLSHPRVRTAYLGEAAL